MILTKEKKAELIQKYGLNSQDTGSAPVQTALLTERINNLTEHLKTHKKDNHSRRGLLLMVAQRERLLKYIHKTSVLNYRDLIKQLNIRGKFN